MDKIPVIFDCDPGHDDAIAIIMALASDRIDIRAITAAPGNQTVEKTAKNVLKVLELCKAYDIPVAKGRHEPLMGKLIVAKEMHGETGMDGPQMPEPTMELSDKDAVELMADTLRVSKEKVTVVITGPFTNVAVLLLAYPELKEKIERFSVMGGGVFIGNRSPYAEFNVWNDPEAARVVFQSGIPIDVYGLDVTHRALIYKEEFHLFREKKDLINQFIADLLDFFSICYMGERKFPGCPMHDSCAVAGLIAPELFTRYEAFIDVDTRGQYTRGNLAVDLRPAERKGKKDNARVALDVDRPRFLELIIRSCDKVAKNLGV